MPSPASPIPTPQLFKLGTETVIVRLTLGNRFLPNWNLIGPLHPRRRVGGHLHFRFYLAVSCHRSEQRGSCFDWIKQIGAKKRCKKFVRVTENRLHRMQMPTSASAVSKTSKAASALSSKGVCRQWWQILEHQT